MEVQSTEQSVGAKYNRELKERSAVLAGYTYFVEKVRTYREDGIPLEEAIDGAIRDCIKGHILEDFFEKRKDEVKKMTQLDYTWERREQLIRKEEYEEGLNDGMERGLERGLERGMERGMEQGLERGIEQGLERGKRDMAVGMFKLMLPVEQIAQAAGESIATVERWIAEQGLQRA